MPHALRFHLQTSLSVEDLGLLWRDLEARSDNTFFLSWQWMAAWIGELGAAPPLLIGEASGGLILLGFVVPYSRREGGILRFDGLRLHSTGVWEQDCIAIEYNGFLVDRGWEGRAEQEAIAWLLNQQQIGKLRPQELHITAMLEQHRMAWTPPRTLTQIPYRKPSWRVDLKAMRASGTKYLDSLSANTRQQVRRAMRLYDDAGGLSVSWADDIPTAFSYLDGLKQLHQHQWEGRGKPGGFASSFFEGFQRRLITACLPQRFVELVRVSRGTEPIGYLYNLIWRGQVFAFVSGLLIEDDNRLKPGLVCHTLCIEHHLRSGAAIYDFMAGEFRYKASLGHPGPDFIYLLIQKDTAAARLEQAVRKGRDQLRGLSNRVMRRPSA